ncbi:hypothetical protein DEO72_LG8g973 [Vigna unguiculata]|uniref:Uncharacterized protein n=1 Tax=Vigna unguiculata TaxID=3917 RepID=A0A4D6MN90_VIGUN|nr:hypothetical protein DEO72_LG8g973 [Vigna unguiculata]
MTFCVACATSSRMGCCIFQQGVGAMVFPVLAWFATPLTGTSSSGGVLWRLLTVFERFWLSSIC